MRPAPGRAPRPTGAPRAAACTPRAARSPARPVRPARERRPSRSMRREMPLRIASQLPRRSQPGAAITPGVSSTREPTVSTASTTAPVKKYISTLVVVPVRRSSMHPDVMPARTSDAVSRPSAGHITSCSQRSSGRSPPIPRSSSIGVWQWVLTSPGSSTPASSRTGPRSGRCLRERPDPGDAPVRDVDGAVAQDRARGVARQHHRGGEPRGPHLSAAARAATAASGTAAATRRCRAGSPASSAAAARGTPRRSPRDRRTRSPRR